MVSSTEISFQVISFDITLDRSSRGVSQEERRQVPCDPRNPPIILLALCIVITLPL